ncbi:GSCFA domain-containing protein [Sunxiuqinia sp. sy24]|uniref:GSCFA domain-containing protein n=1 Tax=Sunxiuqinia sp. sy24 TaxID=3461495 RepID=UPI0040454301
MNQYFTEVKIKDLGWEIDHQSKLMMAGSCFTENIGRQMQRLKFQVDINPFGILYNPQSLAKSLRLLMDAKKYTADDLFEHQGVWHSFDHHSRFSSSDQQQALEGINRQMAQSAAHLKTSDFLILSMGTAWIYELKRTGEIVSNCHKLPAADFKRLRLTPGEIVEEYRELILALWKFNPKLKILFTVSPIRHWKDGAVENQLSKATLLLAIDRLITGFGEEQCAYFPSYEIVMDELRDYRFYAPDMLHISDQAVAHIWQRFASKLLSKESLEINKKVLKIVKAREHRPQNTDSQAYEKFLLYNLNEINNLLKFFPFLNLESEKKYFELELNGYQEKSVK